MSTTQSNTFEIAAAARKLLGFQSLRPGQHEAIQALLSGRDTLLVQPTGSGKSAVYQIAGALLPGATVVISPLIALQKDQADSIQSSRLEPTEVVNSTLSIAEHAKALQRIESGQVEYIFLAPEQFRNPETLDRLRRANVSLIAIDEAHCISQWGHDFRPDYLELGPVIESLGHPPVAAMTATASREVRDEIVARLGLRNPKLIVHGFDRPNISLRVDTFADKDRKAEALLRRVEFADKPGIVYVATHKHAEEIAADLRQIGVDALAYHGGMKCKDREEIQNKFMSGEVPVIVATNAFGMGIDKPDIRFVYHADVSESLDEYYQEIGRAGRDQEPAEAVLFYRSQDISAQQFKTGATHVDEQSLESTFNAIAHHGKPVTREKVTEETGLSARKLVGILQKLEEAGAIGITPDSKYHATTKLPFQRILEEAEQRQQFQKELRMRRLKEMQTYAESRSCRRECLLRRLGDDYQGPCGNCDRCEQAGVLPKAA